MDKLLINTRSGLLKGARDSGVSVWLGVPYARVERFQAPQPVKPWTGIRSATGFAPKCPQHFHGSVKRAKLNPPAYQEDCLSLNIWCPEAGATGPKPVLVWIHGGAFLVGAGSSYNGAELARLGDMLVVTINYRLGVLGFVNFSEALDLPEIPSNLGLRDQIAALEWVRDSITAFGGDPSRVTIAGESAGSISISLLLHCRRAWPLFHGAIMQSGALNLLHERQKSRALGRRYVELLGLQRGDFSALQALGLDQLLAAQAAIGKEQAGGIPAAPWFDDDLLPSSLEVTCQQPTAPVPLIAGANRDEIRLFELMPGDMLPTRWPQLEALLLEQLPAEQAQRILAVYPRTRGGCRALASDMSFIQPTRHFAERHARKYPTWSYRFDFCHPLLGACHGLELAYLWPIDGWLGYIVRGGLMSGPRTALAERIKAHWVHFIHYGRPVAGWPGYEPNSRKVMLFDRMDSIVNDPCLDRHTAWNGRDVLIGTTPPLGRG